MSGLFKRVYQLKIKPLEVFDIAGGQDGAVGQADGGNHGVFCFHGVSPVLSSRGNHAIEVCGIIAKSKSPSFIVVNDGINSLAESLLALAIRQ